MVHSSLQKGHGDESEVGRRGEGEWGIEVFSRDESHWSIASQERDHCLVATAHLEAFGLSLEKDVRSMLCGKVVIIRANTKMTCTGGGAGGVGPRG